ncbi:MAG TPA: ankyrin repeat domain-containing protein [Thermoanaerobaculia bacterium]|jgi:ankyrin repeat protein
MNLVLLLILALFEAADAAPDRLTELTTAIRARDAATVEKLLAADPKLASASAGGRSVVTTALFTFDADAGLIPPQRNEVLQKLLARKPRLDVYETAAVGELPDLQRMLRDDPAAVKRPNALGWTPLHYAAFGGNRANIQILLAAGADVHARAANRFRNTPLIVATLTKQTAAAELLLAVGGDVLDRQAGGFSVLHEAAFTGNLDLVRLYLEKGAELNSRSDDGRTPLSEAMRGKHNAVAEFLKSKGAVAGVTGENLLSSPE